MWIKMDFKKFENFNWIEMDSKYQNLVVNFIENKMN